MKSITIQIIILALFAGFYSCSNLEETPYSSITKASFFKSEQEAQAAVAGIYQGLAGNNAWPVYSWYLEECPGMYGTNRSAASGAMRFRSGQFNFTDAYVNTYVQIRSDVINRCNWAIKYVPNVPMDSVKRNALVAEARWMRAYNYFNLVRLFGDYVAITEPFELADQASMPRTPAVEIYNKLIIPDLQYAAKYLPLSRTDGRLKRGAAPFLLGKVYLTMARNPIKDLSKLPLAKQYLQDVINNQATYGYTILPRFKDVFPLTEDLLGFDPSKELNKELIFSVQQAREVTGHGTQFAYGCAPGSSYFTNYSTGGGAGIGYLGDLFNMYGPTDERKDVTFISSYQRRGTGNTPIVWMANNVPSTTYNPTPTMATQFGICTRKYIDPGSNQCCDQGCDIIIYRLADAYMMLAETENLLNGPNTLVFDNIDVIRKRAKATPVDRTAAWTKNTMDDYIFEERQMEFVCEFHGIYDLRRFGKVEETFKRGFWWVSFFNVSYDPKLELYPVPSDEINRNPLC